MQYIKAKALWKISMAPFAVVQKGASGDADVLNCRLFFRKKSETTKFCDRRKIL